MADRTPFIHRRGGPRPSHARSLSAPAALPDSAELSIHPSFPSPTDDVPSHQRRKSPSLPGRLTPGCPLTSPPEAGDILLVPTSIDPASIFFKHKTLNYYGPRPEGHPIVVLEVHNDLIIGVACTSFSGSSFADKCTSPAWADRYMPIGHTVHPSPDSSLHLQRGHFTRPTYANVETPWVVEWALCEQFRPSRGETGLALTSASFSALVSAVRTWDRPATRNASDHWKIRRWIASNLPLSSLNTTSGKRAISLPPARTRLLVPSSAGPLPSTTSTTTTTTTSSTTTLKTRTWAAVASL